MTGAGRAEGGGRWARRTALFLRAVALVWLARGLMGWAAILGLGEVRDGGALVGASLGAQGALVAFAVLACVAAVGLWLASAWGAVVWLAVALLEHALPLALPRAAAPPGPMAALTLALVLIYLVLAVLSARERSQ